MLVVGLGNPSQQYSGTRHNVGFHVVDTFALQQRIRVDTVVCQALMGTFAFQGETVRIAKPLTYMNNSGVAVSCLLQRFSLTEQQLLVVHDDVDLPLGTMRVSRNRSDAGHLGVRSIAQQVGGGQFSRVRIGIGRPPEGMPTAEYVLSEFLDSEIPVVREMVLRAASAVQEVLSHGVPAAMSLYNAASSPTGE